MKKHILSVAILPLLASAALAADLPSRRAPPVYVPPVAVAPVFTWTGFYLGANAGYAFNGYNSTAIAANDAAAQAGLDGGFVPGFVSSRRSGFTGGGQIGYNYQIGGFSLLGPSTGLLVGVEADAAYIDNRATYSQTVGAVTTTVGSRLDYLGTARGRVGITFDQFLLYGTGGFAYGGARGATNIVGAAGSYFGGYDTIRTGYAYGGGVEYALPTSSFLNVFNSSAVTLKVEYLHYNLGTQGYIAAGNGVAAGSSFTERTRLGGDLVRAGLNFKFGSPLAPAPVVARY